MTVDGKKHSERQKSGCNFLNSVYNEYFTFPPSGPLSIDGFFTGVLVSQPVATGLAGRAAAHITRYSTPLNWAYAATVPSETTSGPEPHHVELHKVVSTCFPAV